MTQQELISKIEKQSLISQDLVMGLIQIIKLCELKVK